MALSGSERRATLSAVQWIESGRTLTLGTKRFWSQFGPMDTYDRVSVISRARSITDDTTRFERSAPETTAGGLAGSTGYPVSDGTGGPLDQATGNVFFTGVFENTAGTTIYRNFSVDFSWTDTLADIYRMMAETILLAEQMGQSEIATAISANEMPDAFSVRADDSSGRSFPIENLRFS